MAFIAVPIGTKYLLFSKVPDLVAGALHPDDPFRHGFAKVQLENELRQAVFAGKLELTDPTTLAPLGLPASDALVRVDNLMDYFSGRVLFVRGDSENSDSSEIDNSPAGYFSVREVAAVGETPRQRQARRYQMCLDAKLTMPTNDYSHLPRGIGNLARAEGITRQAFAEDVKAYIRRLSNR